MAISNNPFEHELLPPPDETEAERIARLKKEKDQRAVSDEIDALLRKEREEEIARRKHGSVCKILLLGQSESGKSTLLKNFQMMYTPNTFRLERASWKPIIFLNLVRNVRTLLDQLSYSLPENNDSGGNTRYPSRSASRSPRASRGTSPVCPPSPNSRMLSSVEEDAGYIPAPDIPGDDSDLRDLHRRLYPIIVDLEESLIRKINPTWYEFYQRTRANELSGNSLLLKKPFIQTTNLTVQALSSWKAALLGHPQARDPDDTNPDLDSQDEPDEFIATSLRKWREAIENLWHDLRVKQILEARNLRLEETGGFFLDSLQEICASNYTPSVDHVLRARIKTVGVTEHHFEPEPGHYWRVFDVGGHRSLRAAWVPYFDDIDWILFLVPISAFDQVLEEAPKVNRLEDSVNLWKYLVSNRLLMHASIILFLNKMDLMKVKLEESNIQLKDYVVSYGPKRPNNLTACCNYLKKKFAGIMQDKSPVKRLFFCHLTTVTNTQSTALVLKSIHERLFRRNLEEAQMLA